MRSVFLITLVCSVPVMLLRNSLSVSDLSLLSCEFATRNYYNVIHYKTPKKTENLLRLCTPANKLLMFRDDACHVFNFQDSSGKILYSKFCWFQDFVGRILKFKMFAARILKIEDFSTQCNLTRHHNSPLITHHS